ncbi:exodeoxyribonuclease V subunit alpha [Nocardioides sp. dk4132]|uniref:exodeoxyribonuclease V subunit alpha n=1 Tax=unclassified Nocardioides TaxID=2615069 RepID=UPI0012981964|nr:MULTISPECIES: exodeoxyribonuclease V subunit alpha [unclassified Nocardioides]MQW77569.1 exodeoxyribonuclease V subunit alpha [Nocardioides sp. dk4132]QGA06100.1 exodeoxyribonuclease V subunit alpha [Nocardioides sp. dk884]
MIERFEVEDRFDARLAIGAAGLLRTFNHAGVITAADVHVATRLGELTGTVDEEVRLALALAVRAARHGSVCVDLAAVAALAAPDPDEVASAGEPDPLPWPEVEGWLARVAASPAAAASVVQVEHGQLYLDRYWREEGQVRDDLLTRAAAVAPSVDPARLEATAARLFPGEGYAEQRAAALAAARQWTTVLTGGPGTGKTTTVAGLLALLTDQAEASGRRLRIALTAPTGKAAARLQQAVEEAQRSERFTDDDRIRLAELGASTLHRLLGWVPESSTRFRHHRGNKLPHDVVVVDETSMLSLTMMARLLESVRPDARLVLVGDPDQLASVEAGAVLSDLVQGLAGTAPDAVAALRTTHRFGGSIGALAQALRAGDADEVLTLLTSGADDVELIDPDDPDATDQLRGLLVQHALAVREAALAGDAEAAVAATDDHRLLCAHRDGPWGVNHWNRQVERWLGEATGQPVGAVWGQEWYAGRPLLVTANDYGLGLFNGDTGVVVREDDELRAVVAGVGEHLRFATSRLSDVDTLHAMTVHKSQGSQAREVTVLLPPEDSPLLTRELFYTAVTRAQERVRVVGSQAAVRAAVAHRVQRATGLRQRLRAATQVRGAEV